MRHATARGWGGRPPTIDGRYGLPAIDRPAWRQIMGAAADLLTVGCIGPGLLLFFGVDKVWIQPMVEKLGHQGHHRYMVRICMSSATDWEMVLSTTLEHVVDASKGLTPHASE